MSTFVLSESSDCFLKSKVRGVLCFARIGHRGVAKNHGD